MKKGLWITALIILGLLVAAVLIIVALIEVVEALIGIVLWAVVILAGHLFFKSKT